jgi:hypothetical protein
VVSVFLRVTLRLIVLLDDMMDVNVMMRDYILYCGTLLLVGVKSV